MTTKQDEFITELTALSIKYNLWIGGCGCCQSPWAMPLDTKTENSKYAYEVDSDSDILDIHPVEIYGI